MPIVQTANGPVMVDDNAPPEVIARIRAQGAKAAPGRQSAPATPAQPVSADQREINNRVAQQRAANRSGLFGETGAGLLRKVAQGFTFNNMDEVDGALHALGKVGQGWDAMKHEYRIARDTSRAVEHQQAGGTGGTIAEIAGALANPIADGAVALKAAGKFVPVLARAGTKLAAAPALVRGAAAGANQGALNAVGSADNSDHLLSDAGQGYFVGGLTGGALGGAATGLRRGVQILRDRGVEAADRIAYTKIGQMLDKGGISPTQAQRELAVTNARGGDGMVQDLTPGLRAQAGALSRRPDVAASNDLIDRGEQRLLSRDDRFDAELKKRVGTADATAHMDALKATRQGQGNVDYQAALDGKFHWSPELKQFMDTAPAEMHDAMRKGAHLASLHDQDIGKLGMNINPLDGSITMDTTPSLRVFDYAKRAMDTKIKAAYSAGDAPYAAGLSHQLDKFKQLVMNAAPDYAPALAKQRDYFQRQQATELGLDVIKRLRTDPKAVMKDLQALDPAHHDDARQGIVDALLNLRNQKADPVSFIASVARSPEQRQVLEFAFGGKQNFNGFARWMGRELRAKKADVLTAPGRQSETARFQAADDSLSSGVGGIAEAAGRGFAYGGQAGMSAALLRKFTDLKNGLSPHALDAMATALMSDGKELPGKVAAAAKFAAGRKARNAKWATRIAKAAQQPMTDYTGD